MNCDRLINIKYIIESDTLCFTVITVVDIPIS